MKVILGCDPLLSQLGGIGHYTRSLAIELVNNSDITDFKLYAHGKFYSNSILQLNCNVGIDSKNTSDTLIGKLRSKLSTSQLAVNVYLQAAPIIEKYSLKKYNDYIFHSPNFLLPNFQGKRAVTIHDLSTIKYPEFHPETRVKIVNSAIEHSSKVAEHIIVDSQYVKNELINYAGIESSRISVVRLGVSADFYPRTEFECLSVLNKYNLNFKRYFLFVSTIEPRKNLCNILNAYEKYRINEPNGLPFVLIGGMGWKSEGIHKKISQLENKGWVKYIGYIDQAEIPKIYAAATGLIFPSIYEGFGLPIVEAQASGVPVLTSKNSAMSEIADKCAILVEPSDVEEISIAIHQLAAIGNPSNNNVDNVFSWFDSMKQLVKVYQSIDRL